MLIVQTARLTLRRFEPEDLEALFALYRDPDIRRYFPEGTRTLAETEEELEWHRYGHSQHPELGLWATVERSSGKLLGRCGPLPWTIDDVPEVELAFLIDRRAGVKVSRPRLPWRYVAMHASACTCSD